MSGAEMIAAERQRQAEMGFGPEHDDQHTRHELIDLAGRVMVMVEQSDGPYQSAEWVVARSKHIRLKYARDKIRLLRITGALIAAEIDRLQRAAT
jgi:hypothetical protein